MANSIKIWLLFQLEKLHLFPQKNLLQLPILTKDSTRLVLLVTIQKFLQLSLKLSSMILQRVRFKENCLIIMNKHITHKHGTKILDQESTISRSLDKSNSILLVRIQFSNRKCLTVKMENSRVKHQDQEHIKQWSQLKRKLMSIKE